MATVTTRLPRTGRRPAAAGAHRVSPILLALAFLAGVWAPARAVGTVGPITFEEAEFVPGAAVGGLTVHSVGGAPLPAPLSFGFTLPDASIGNLVGTTFFLHGASIQGNAAGVLTIHFGTDVTRVAFGFAQNCPAPNNAQVFMTARNAAGTSVGTTLVRGQDFGFFFLETLVDYTPPFPPGGVTLFRSVEMSFDPSQCDRFAIDNLTYDDAPDVPALAPTAVLLLALGLLATGSLISWRASRGDAPP